MNGRMVLLAVLTVAGLCGCRTQRFQVYGDEAVRTNVPPALLARAVEMAHGEMKSPAPVDEEASGARCAACVRGWQAGRVEAPERYELERTTTTFDDIVDGPLTVEMIAGPEMPTLLFVTSKDSATSRRFIDQVVIGLLHLGARLR